MRISILALFAALPLVAPTSRAMTVPWATPQGHDLAPLIEAEMQSAADATVDELWRRAAKLRDAARELGSEGLDAALDGQLAKPGISEGARLLLAGLRIQGADVDAEKLAEALTPLLDSKRDEIAAGAAGLLADASFRGLATEPRNALVARIFAVADDGARAPNVRLEAAYAAGKIGGGADISKSRGVMRSFLESNDGELRALGALTLARSGAELSGQLFEELRRLSILPGENGRLAASFLDKERVRETGERKLKNLAALNQPSSADPAAAEIARDETDNLNKLIAMITNAHLEGDKVTRDELVEAAMQGMLASLDEHSSFMSSKVYARFEQELAAAYGGIGAYVGEDREDSLFTITHPIYSGPAYKAGLLSEDKIVRIDDWPTLGKPVDEIIKRLKGKPGTPVQLYVWRRGMDSALIDRPTDDMIVTVTRAAITIPTEQHQMLPGKIGLLVLHEFSQVASDELRKPLRDMLDAGMQAVIFDLRNNSGGLLDEAVNVSSLFLPRNSLVVSTESRVKATEKLYTEADPIIPPDMPVIVLINRFSASAAEIVAGALQDHGRALVIGKRSFGKGSVQNLMLLKGGASDDKYADENKNGRWDNWEKITRDWNNNGEFDFGPRVKLTIARYLLPTNRSIHRELDKDGNIVNPGGVEPDLEVASSRIDSWRIEEMFEVRNSHAPRDYVDKHWSEFKERFSQIADNDRKDTSLYPGFQAFYDSLDTPLPADDVRQLLRFEIRRRIQDQRGVEFPQGDFVEDVQLQEGIRAALSKLGQSTADFAEYQATIPPSAAPRLNVASKDERDMRAALAQLDQALKGDRKLSEGTLRELRELLSSSLDGDR